MIDPQKLKLDLNINISSMLLYIRIVREQMKTITGLLSCVQCYQ